MRRFVPERIQTIPMHAHRVFQGVLYGVYQWEQEMFDGSFETFEMLQRPDTVQVLVIDHEQIVVQHEEQPFLGTFYAVPGGRHDHESEDELAAAQRELREESGLICKNWKLLDVIQPNRKIDQLIYVFLADEVTGEVPQKLDPGEKIFVERYDFDAFKALAEEGDFCDQLKILSDVDSLEELRRLPDLYAA